MRAISLIVSCWLVFIFHVYLSTFSMLGLRFIVPWRTMMMIERGGVSSKTWTPLNDIPESLRKSVVASEDGLFYEHHGVDWQSLKKNGVKNFKILKKRQENKKILKGSSTIPMQLVKNLYLTKQKSLLRKALEIPLALQLDFLVPKDRILELYLNLIEWGPGIYGAEAASEYYFKKPVQKISDSEAAFLASIIPNPIKWGRYPPGPFIRHRQEVLLHRKNSVEEPLDEEAHEEGTE